MTDLRDQTADLCRCGHWSDRHMVRGRTTQYWGDCHDCDCKLFEPKVVGDNAVEADRG